MNELKAKLQDLFWNVQDKWDTFMADPKKSHLAAAIAGLVIGVALGRL